MELHYALFLLAFVSQIVWSEPVSIVQRPYDLQTADGLLRGSLVVPSQKKKVPLALLIPGSGPTDRNGNSPAGGRNAYLQHLAGALAENGIATLRYDKRGVGQSQAAGPRNQDLKVSDYVADIIDWERQLHQDARFSEIILIGHSEGALMASLAAPYTQASGLIVLAGTGRSIDQVLLQQMQERLNAEQYSQASKLIAELKQGQTDTNIPAVLSDVLHPSVQPYLVSLFRHDPQQALARVSIPCLIIHGSNDIQVSQQDAELLHQAQPRCEQVTVTGMNHFLRIAPERGLSQLYSYNDPDLPLAEQLTDVITDFVQQP